MGRVIAIVDAESGLGYRLAGIDVRCAATPGELGRQAQELLEDAGARLVILAEELFRELPRLLQRTLEESRSPLFVPVPSGPLRTGALAPDEYVARLMRRAIGYQVRIRGPEKP